MGRSDDATASHTSRREKRIKIELELADDNYILGVAKARIELEIAAIHTLAGLYLSAALPHFGHQTVTLTGTGLTDGRYSGIWVDARVNLRACGKVKSSAQTHS